MADTVIGDLFVRLGVDLNELNKGFSSAENRLEKFGTRMFFLGSRITAGVTLPFTAAVGAVNKWGMEFDKAMTESLAIMDNVTPAIRTQMAGVAKSVSDFSKFSAKEGAEGFYHLASAGLDAQTSMGALPIAAKFAQAGVFDLAKSTEFLAGAQASMATGAETSAEKVAQMARVADVLTLANNRALGTVHDFADALTSHAGAALRLMHKDIEEGVAVLAAYAEQNIKGKTAGMQLAISIRDLSTYALKNADAFEKFGISVYNSQGQMKNMADIIESVEQATNKMSDAQIRSMFLELGIPLRSQRATQALIGYSQAIRDHEKALRDAGGTTDKVANEQMKALSNQVLQLWNQFKTASVEIFESFVPVIEHSVVPAMKAALQYFKDFGKEVEQLPEPVKLWGLALLASVAALGPLTAALGSFTLLASAALRGVQALLSPLGLITTAIIAASVAIVEVNKETGSWRDTLIALATPFGATAVLLERFAHWLGMDTQLARDLGAIFRDVVVLSFEAGTKAIREFGTWSMGVIGGLYDYAKDKLTWLMNTLGAALPADMRMAIAAIEVMEKRAPGMYDAITKSMHDARLAMDRAAGIRDTGGVSATHSAETFGIGIGGAKPTAGRPAPPGGMPDLPEGGGKLSDAEKMMQRLTGKDLQDDIAATTAAFRQLVATGQDVKPEIHERMWEAYKKLRGETSALVPEFEHLFKEEIKAHDEAAAMAAAAAGWGNTWGDAAAEAIHGMKGVTAIQNQVFYSSDKAMEGVRELVDKSTAKLADMETQLHRFSESSGEAHRSTLRSNLAQIMRDQDEHYRDQLKGLAMVDGAKYDEYVRYLNRLKAQDAAYLRVYEAVESGKFAASIGVNDKILRNWEKMSQGQRDQIILTQSRWNQFVHDMERTVGTFDALGDLLLTAGGPMSDFGNAVKFAAQNMADFLKAGQDIMSGNTIKGVIEAATAAIKAIQIMRDTGSRAGRAAIGAETGFMLGGPIGAFIGAAAGFLMKDPGWKKVQNSIDSMWNISVSKELAKTIDADSKNLGGRVNAMLAHLGDIIEAGGGLTAANVDSWAGRLTQVFTSLVQGTLNTSQAAGILDNSFASLVKTGTTTNGLVSEQIVRLVQLERQYKTGSAAIQEFVDKQLSMAAGGFNKIVGGMFGPLTTGQEQLNKLDQDQEAIHERIMKLQAQIADYEKQGTKNEKQRVALILARVNLAKQERLLRESEAKEASISNQVAQFMDESEHVSADAQAKFDRMGRLALVTFNAMIASGHTYSESIASIGDGLDILIEAQKEFGLTSSDAFSQLMKFRDFSTVHPELMDELDGLSQMMVGLSNTSFLTAGTFNDLGDTAADVFQQMVDGGLTADEALSFMQPQLQLLWELQRKFGFAVDESTGKLLDMAEANGTVGTQYMSANDKMVLGIDKLIARFDLFLKHLGIDIPAEAEAAAGAVNDAFNGVNPQVDVDINYHEHGKPNPEGDHTEPAMAEGGVLTRPTHVLAGEAGPEAIVPLDRLFAEMQAQSLANGEGKVVVPVYIDGVKFMEVIATNARRQGLTR